MITNNFNTPADQFLVWDFNNSLLLLEKECVNEVSLNDAPGSKEQSVSMYNHICHAYLRRIINIAKQYANTINQRESLTAAILGRAMLETVAHFHRMLNQTEKYLTSNNFPKAYHLLASHLSGGRHKFIPENIQFKEFHIMDSIRDMDKVQNGMASQYYDWACEFVHPNSMGTTMSFSQINKENNTAKFFEKISDDTTITCESGWLAQFLNDWNRVLGIKELLMANWRPINVLELLQSE